MESLRLAEGKNARPDLAITCFRYAVLLRDKGDCQQAQDYLTRAADLCQEMAMTWWLEAAEQVRPSLASTSPHLSST